MRFKRNEPFRFSFSLPLPCTFQIYSIDDHITPDSTMEAGSISNISFSGLHLISSVSYPMDSLAFTLVVYTTIHIHPISLYGTIQWKKQVNVNEFHYGLKCHTSEELRKIIKNEIIYYQKKHDAF